MKSQFEVVSMLLFLLFTTVVTSNFHFSDGQNVFHEQGDHGPVVRMYNADDSPKESWAYVTVRPKAHMFYWLYHSTHTAGYLNRPLILWLQGGPGGSGTGFGNFNELGPLDVNMKPRNTTWLQVSSLLFVDNPVGTGFSYADDDSGYTTNVQEISMDLLTLIKAFVHTHSDFQKIPLYIFSESYGGKMTAAFSAVLLNAIKKGELKMNFKGLAMGDSWISPIDSVMSWGPFLRATSIVSQAGQDAIISGAKKCQGYTDQGQFAQATAAWSRLEDIVEEVGSNVNFYNILDFSDEATDLNRDVDRHLGFPAKLFQRHVLALQSDPLSELMNGVIRRKLKIIPKNIVWGGQAGQVFVKQSRDFMRNVTDTVNKLVNGRDLKVVVYSGQLDLICNVLGTEAWFSRLDVSKPFSKVKKQTYSCGKQSPVCYFGSSYQNVEFYWILNAGHMVPSDNGPAALAMVSQIIQ